MFLNQMTPQQLDTHKTKVQSFLDNKLPKIKTTIPSLSGLVIYNEGRMLTACLSSAQSFYAIRPMVNTYRQLLPTLEKHLLTIISFVNIKQGNIIVTTKDHLPTATLPESSASSQGGDPSPSPSTQAASAPSRPESFRDYPDGSLPSHITDFFPHVSRLRTELSIAKEQLNALATTDNPSQEELARLANIVAIKDERWRNFRQRVSIYYDKYQEYKIDQQELDRLEKRAAQLEELDTDTLAKVEKPHTPQSTMTIHQLLQFPESEEREQAIKARIERNKKYLRRTDRQKSDELLQSIKDAVEELHAINILITDKQTEVCAFFGYDVPKEWQEPSPEEKKAQQAKAKSEKAKAKRAEAREAREAQEAEEARLNPYNGLP